MRGGSDASHAFGLEPARDLDTFARINRSVVQSRENVIVQIDHDPLLDSRLTCVTPIVVHKKIPT
jgi:hypothetical protein